MQIVAEHRSFGGVQGVYRHPSKACGCDMTFGLYLPPAAARGPVPILWYLSGLSCTHENAMTKAAAQGWAARAGLAICFPDTSPRGDTVADDTAYDLGQGAGFYVDATETPWSPHFRMWTYVTDELSALLAAEFAIDPDRQAISGHSMGGHGALTVAMHHPDRFASVSAFAPIAHPVASDWGRKQFGNYLGADEARWTAHDATLLMTDRGFPGPVLVDQGTADPFIGLLRPADLARAMAARGQASTFRMQPGHDHSYFFVQSFMEDHIAFHARALGL